MRLWPFSVIGNSIRRGREKQAAEEQALTGFERLVCQLPQESARSAALNRLQANDAFSVEPAAHDDFLPPEMPDSLRDLFHLYRSVDWKGISWIRLEEWSECPGLPGHYLIGMDTEQSLVCGARTGMIGIYVGDGQFTSTFPSVFHWLLVLGADPTGLNLPFAGERKDG